ncbi:single-stranded-DNA-specific exonuclease RecJ [Labrys monachus]|uniref:Single-stranded-DNA-specific exonuclease RecJ n=1 Tax=Labrys monachus TaxID=217067 RepID=A0ABU0FEQ4_9HYPH|nr:single-stranded-DNA-specific exonuclease RecJ [Labrys monachus]MDQ0393099.1 single-stranded-DNA-specific exonuclease [Labrys monachus]
MLSPATLPRFFLDVQSSFTGKAWRDRLDGKGQMLALALAQRAGLPDLLARVLAGRGVTPEEADAFLDPSIRHFMPDPSLLRDMDKAAERLADAVMAGEKVAIFGDYDVDGATSSALLAGWLAEAGATPRIHIPDRIFEGYGPNEEAIRQLRAEGAGLLVTVDCGTTSIDVLALAAAIGFETLVVDHHQAGETLPEAVAVVNPNRLDDLSGQGHLCACGVTFLLLVAANRALRRRGWWTPARPEPDLLSRLDLVALGTVADVVPLKGLNRAFVARGLAVMRLRRRAGLRALMDMARLDGPPRPYHLGFLLGPRINAGGRIGDAALGARLLVTEDDQEASAIAATLDRLNRERQAVEAGMLEEALVEAVAALGAEEKGAAIVTASANWHPGVVGLVAARLKERFGRPAFAIAFNKEGVGTGSGRSIGGVDLGRAVRLAVERGLLAKGGGHAMAAGVTLAQAELGAFRAFLEAELRHGVEAARAAAAIEIDGALAASGASIELAEMLERAGPFGQGNPEPVLALPAHRVAFADEVGGAHLRLRLKGHDGAMLDAIAFRAVGQPLGAKLLAHRGKPVHVAGSLSVDRWGGRERLQFRVLDAASADGAA